MAASSVFRGSFQSKSEAPPAGVDWPVWRATTRHSWSERRAQGKRWLTGPVRSISTLGPTGMNFAEFAHTASACPPLPERGLRSAGRTDNLGRRLYEGGNCARVIDESSSGLPDGSFQGTGGNQQSPYSRLISGGPSTWRGRFPDPAILGTDRSGRRAAGRWPYHRRAPRAGDSKPPT